MYKYWYRYRVSMIRGEGVVDLRFVMEVKGMHDS